MRGTNPSLNAHSQIGGPVFDMTLSTRYNAVPHGRVAQLGERLPRTEEVEGSNPFPSTIVSLRRPFNRRGVLLIPYRLSFSLCSSPGMNFCCEGLSVYSVQTSSSAVIWYS